MGAVIMTSYICIIQIGPVQPFIEAARKVSDLTTGSHLLSQLAASGIEHVLQMGGELIYPSVDENGRLPESVPHRFAFLLDTDNPSLMLRQTEDIIQDLWRSYTEKVRSHLQKSVDDEQNWTRVYDEQVSHWPAFTGIALPYDHEDHARSMRRANQMMAARKQARLFDQIEDAYDDKCTVTGAHRQLPLNWKQLQNAVSDVVIRDNERLGGLAIFKRFASRTGIVKITNITDVEQIAGVIVSEDQAGRDASGYYAVVHMDGDRIGQHLSTLSSLKEHQRFSSMLATFAHEIVPQIIGSYNDQSVGATSLIYAGGDDVLALLPLDVVFPCIQQIQQQFTVLVKQVGADLTMSAGVAVTPIRYPLSLALDAARQAEKYAKNVLGRNAVAIVETTSGGQIRETGAPWQIDDQNTLDVLDFIRRTFAARQISSRIAYDVRELHTAYHGDDMQQARDLELRRLLKQRAGESLSQAERDDLIDVVATALMPLGEALNWERLSNWLIMMRFIAEDTSVSTVPMSEVLYE